MLCHKTVKNGFGIVEVMIAAAIMMVVIFAMTAAGRSSLRGAIYLHERAQAMYLAQEGIEQVRQVRDSKWLDNSNTTTFQEFINYGAEYTADPAKKWVVSYDGALSNFGVADLLADESNSIINIDGTEFKRNVVFIPILITNSILPTFGSFNTVAKPQSAIKAVINISWKNNDQDKSVSVSELLTNWRMNY